MTHSSNAEALNILAKARERENAREAARKPINYERMKVIFPKQKAALTRAMNTADPAKRRNAVLLACKKTITEWDDEIGAWPDDWARWQRALDDTFPVFDAPRLEDL